MSVFLKGCGFKPRRESEERKSEERKSEERMAALRFAEKLDFGWRSAFSAAIKPLFSDGL
jgi:hypothetical protein